VKSGIKRVIDKLSGRKDPERGYNTLESDYTSTQKLIFIGGCGRSGTTLVRTILDSHSEICCGPESNLLLPAPIRPRDLAAKFSFHEAELVEALAVDSTCRAHFIDLFANTCRQKVGKRRWAEKTPRNVLHLNYLFHSFPNSLFIDVIRDGRDVACSLRTHPRHRVENGQLVPVNTWRPIAECVTRWTDSIEASRPHWDDARYYPLRYEDLILQTEKTLRDLMKFIDEPWEDALLDHTSVDSPFRDALHFPQNPEVLKPRYNDSLGRWRSDLSDTDKATFKELANRQLVELGYAADSEW
jgi:protein-tyrosine sulfotransferase